MPGMSGRELAEEFLTVSPMTHVLYMSGIHRRCRAVERRVVGGRLGVVQSNEALVLAKPLQDMVVNGAKNVGRRTLLDLEFCPAHPDFRERIADRIACLAFAQEPGGVVHRYR
jgi:hypothetical protein